MVTLVVGIVLTILLPNLLLGTYYADIRLPGELIFVLIAASNARLSGTAVRIFVLVSACLLLLRLGGTALNTAESAEQYAELEKVYSRMAPGGVVFAARTMRQDEPWDYPENWHLQWERGNSIAPWQAETLAVLWSPVFVPETFMDGTQNPVVRRVSYEPLTRFEDRDNPIYLTDSAQMAQWLARIVRASKVYRFPVIYVAIIDPGNRIMPPANAQVLYHAHGHQIWQISQE
jgi:hypothetical protein